MLVAVGVSAFGADLDFFQFGMSTLTDSVVIAGGMAVVPMSIDAIEAKARELSNFGGEMQMYTGAGDDLLDFNGQSTDFSLKKSLDKQFSFKLVNANAATRTAVLFAGYLTGNATLAPGQLINGAFNDINGDAGLTGSNVSAQDIASLQNYLIHNPTRLEAMKIKSTDATQIEESLVYQRLSPFQTEPSVNIRPSDFINQDSNQDKISVFPVAVQLDDQSKIQLPVVGSSTVVITLYFGASLNPAKGLEVKAQRAQTNINILQGR